MDSLAFDFSQPSFQLCCTLRSTNIFYRMMFGVDRRQTHTRQGLMVSTLSDPLCAGSSWRAGWLGIDGDARIAILIYSLDAEDVVVL
jgi:hypothetical protein